MFRVIFHLDMDAFYASIEQRDHPHLRGKPVVVGSPPYQRGVVCAASYEARKHGIRSAMPSSTAARLCPQAIFIPPRMAQYREESAAIMQILAATGAQIEPMSIDEAYMDLSPVIAQELPNRSADLSNPDSALYHSVPIAKNLKRQITVQRGLTASIGIAANKLLAKLASDFKKPDGLTLIPERDKVQFLRPMSVRAIHGVGKATEQILNGAGIFTVADLQDYPGDLRALAGSFGSKLREYALGQDDRPLEIGDEIKSISSEETFERDTDDRQILKRCLFAQAKEISERLRRRQLAAHTVQIKIRYTDFTTLTRQISVEEPVWDPKDLYRLGCYLLARDRLVHRPLRLLGLGTTGLGEMTQRQLRFGW